MSADTPDISILVCVHNRADLTGPFLESLFATLPDGISREVLVFDDQSTDGTGDLLSSYGDRIRVFRDPDRGCFARNNNRLVHEARGRRLVLLNNDMILRPGWLEPMMALMDERTAGIVGNLQVFPGSGLINHAGGGYERDLTPVNLYEGLSPSIDAARLTRKMRFVTAACWLVERPLYKSLGGFDEGFINGYEDADFCLRALDRGASIWYCGSSVIEHYGSSSPGRFGRQAANRRVFLRRWKGRVEPDLESITRGDGISWPKRGGAERVLRSIVRAPLIGGVVDRLSGFGPAVALRSWVKRVLARG